MTCRSAAEAEPGTDRATTASLANHRPSNGAFTRVSKRKPAINQETNPFAWLRSVAQAPSTCCGESETSSCPSRGPTLALRVRSGCGSSVEQWGSQALLRKGHSRLSLIRIVLGLPGGDLANRIYRRGTGSRLEGLRTSHKPSGPYNRIAARANAKAFDPSSDHATP
jgi:hypothetical protein